MTQTITLTFTVTVELPDGAQLTVAAPPVVTGPKLAVVPPPALGPVGDHSLAVAKVRSPRLGGLQRSVLTALADAGGHVADGKGKAGAHLAALVGTPANNCATCCRVLERSGFVARVMRNSKRCTRVSLTPAGWDAIGRTPPSPKDTAGPPASAPERTVPPMPEPGPIGRHRFDPDEVRNAQADAL